MGSPIAGTIRVRSKPSEAKKGGGLGPRKSLAAERRIQTFN